MTRRNEVTLAEEAAKQRLNLLMNSLSSLICSLSPSLSLFTVMLAHLEHEHVRTDAHSLPLLLVI